MLDDLDVKLALSCSTPSSCNVSFHHNNLKLFSGAQEGWAHTSVPVQEAVSHWIFAGLFCKGRWGISSSPLAEPDFPATVLLPLERAEVGAFCCFCFFEFQPRMTKVSSRDGNRRTNLRFLLSPILFSFYSSLPPKNGDITSNGLIFLITRVSWFIQILRSVPK